MSGSSFFYRRSDTGSSHPDPKPWLFGYQPSSGVDAVSIGAEKGIFGYGTDICKKIVLFKINFPILYIFLSISESIYIYLVCGGGGGFN